MHDYRVMSACLKIVFLLERKGYGESREENHRKEGTVSNGHQQYSAY
jgi:hypothetical protein